MIECEKKRTSEWRRHCVLVPEETVAEEIRTRFLLIQEVGQLPTYHGAEEAPVDAARRHRESMLKRRFFLQHVWYALHAALAGDQNMVGWCTFIELGFDPWLFMQLVSNS